MKSYPFLRHPLLSLLLSSCLASVPAAAAEDTPTVNRDRLWLPPSSAHLMPMLEYAAELALSNPDCREVLYGRLNEFRSGQGEEPALTILCQQDARTTFNIVYRASQLENALYTEDIEFSDEDAAGNLEALRQLLMSDTELRDQHLNQPANPGSETQETAEEDLDLELELDDLLRDRQRPSEDPPELF